MPGTIILPMRHEQESFGRKDHKLHPKQKTKIFSIVQVFVKPTKTENGKIYQLFTTSKKIIFLVKTKFTLQQVNYNFKISLGSTIREFNPE